MISRYQPMTFAQANVIAKSRHISFTVNGMSQWATIDDIDSKRILEISHTNGIFAQPAFGDSSYRFFELESGGVVGSINIHTLSFVIYNTLKSEPLKSEPLIDNR